MLRAALRDLQWRWKRFSIAVVGVGLVFAMGLLMTGLSDSFSLEVDRTLEAIGAETWAVSTSASGPFTSFVPMPADAAGPDASPVIVLRQTIADDDGDLTDILIVGVEPGRLGAPHATRGRDLAGPGDAVVDDSLDVASLDDDFSTGGRPFHVVGTVSDQRLYAGLPVVYVPLPDAQAIGTLGRPVATAFLYGPAPAATPEGMKLMSTQEVKTDLLRPLQHAISSVAFVRILLWLVAATIVGSVLYLQATERTRDFAVFKATGTSTFAIGAGLAVQAVALSLVAAALAAVLATLLVPVFPMPVEISTRTYLVLPIVTVTVGLLASVVALRRTATVQPALAFGG
jgi:putative ABC transport system permease protein